MDGNRLTVYGLAAALDRGEEWHLESERAGEKSPEIGPEGPPGRLLWCRITSGAPGDPPDERYYAEEVRPGAVGSEGHIEWDTVPGGLSQIVVHNVAEVGAGTHALGVDTVVRVEECLDRSSPPAMVYLTFVPAPDHRLARIVSYDGGTYTVQPVRREPGGFVDEGPQITGAPNLGELWNDEAGYLQGPSDFDRYVEILRTPAGWTILLHPPRMV